MASAAEQADIDFGQSQQRILGGDQDVARRRNRKARPQGHLGLGAQVASLGPGSPRVPLDRPAIAVLAASDPRVAAGRDGATLPATSFAVIET